MKQSLWTTSPTAGHETHGQAAVYSEADGKTVALVYDGDAHANLIAAAPELLEALESCYSELNQLAFLQKDKLAKLTLDQARQAISKAKGDL